MATDYISNCDEIIECSHDMVHRSAHFFINNSFSLNGSATANIILEIPESNNCHMLFSIESDTAGFTLTTFEDATSNADGTVISPLNNNRRSSVSSNFVCRINPTGVSTSGATTLRGPIYAGNATNPAKCSAGTLQSMIETILAKNKKYLVQITNLYASAQNFNYDFQWYEVPNG